MSINFYLDVYYFIAPIHRNPNLHEYLNLPIWTADISQWNDYDLSSLCSSFETIETLSSNRNLHSSLDDDI